MRIIRNTVLPPKGFVAINLFTLVFVRYGVAITDRTLRHEVIHSEQMKELGFVFFYIWYGIEYLVKLIKYRNSNKAYRNISFEREAYAKDFELGYITRRKRYNWIWML